MFYHDKELQYKVRVDKPNPAFARMLQQAIGGDTMHQIQWLAVIEEPGGVQGVHPIPNSFPQSQEVQEFNYAFVSTYIHTGDGSTPTGRWASGRSMDGKGEFHLKKAAPLGGEPKLAPPVPEGHAQTEQMTLTDTMMGNMKDTLGL